MLRRITPHHRGRPGALCAAPASAATVEVRLRTQLPACVRGRRRGGQDLRSPDAVDAGRPATRSQDLRSPSDA